MISSFQNLLCFSMWYVTDVWWCDSNVILTLTLSSQNKNKRKGNNKWEKKNKIVRVHYLEL